VADVALHSGIARDERDGAAHIAAFAAEARDVRVTQAATSPFTLVRLASAARTATLLVPRESRALLEDHEWLVATTRH
jgi:hypothetical protein